MFKKNKGFTLVELLVVLAIIGILVGLAIGGIRIVQQVNRDTQRKAFIRDIQLLLEAHQERKNKYPDSIDITEGGGDCGENEVLIETLAGTTTIEEGCSKINFSDIDSDDDCTTLAGTDDKEKESGSLTMCYDGEGKGYQLYVMLERSSPHNASNVEPTS